MRATFFVSAWVGRGIVAAGLVMSAFAPVAFCASTTVLFPKPLHLVRKIEDPLAKSTSTVHEYCAGNRVITVSGSKVAIADFGKQELTEIDRDAGTYSVTRFDEIAKAQADDRRAVATKSAKHEEWKATPRGVRPSAAGRSMDSWEFVRGDEHDRTTIEVGIDRRIALSRDAVEVLVGASYPNPRRDEQDALLRAASPGTPGGMRQATSGGGPGAAQTPADYGLPVEQVFTFEAEGTRITLRNSVLEVTEDLPPAELVIIPPGSQLVESHTARLQRELREADELPGQPSRP